MTSPHTPDSRLTARLALADGTVLRGRGFGAEGARAGELCFNTAMTGYQEILTDPSYAGQIVTFTFPHVGNVGANPQDDEAGQAAALGAVVRDDPTAPSNWRATGAFGDWMIARGLIGVGGVDTRRLTRLIRTRGMPHAVIAHARDGVFDEAALVAQARAFAGLVGADLARDVTTAQGYDWTEGAWVWPEGYARHSAPVRRVVAVDYGAKRNILRLLTDAGCAVMVVPASVTAAQVKALNPDGLFLSNGPGDPAATAAYAAPMIREIIETTDIAVFGICLGHQMLGLALGASTVKMNHGHHGANHPVKDLETGRVEITSMNHGFAVDAQTLPAGVVETHVSLFDGSNCGLRLNGRPVFSVQYHPEASPGPQDSGYLFQRFVAAMPPRAA
ncbi:MAG: carbamoyl phosphate synthase small subunit [Rhodobacterales bacterium CG_4_10_14_0_8_um_filter_70_9]|nr:MAG: carbamoyl phosphate synthase small subunit [Rhodobacterales bacterium CG_4_10_14_0_8_um_filter_70_9]